MIDLTIEKPVSIAEVQSLLGVHRRTVEAWFHRGLERIKIGRRVYTSREAIQRFASPEAAAADEARGEGQHAARELRRRFGIGTGGRRNGSAN